MNEDLVRLAVLDVGQGDTIVLTHPASGEAIVIDCVDEFGVMDYLKSQKVREIKALILTHLHSDHYRRARAFLDNCEGVLGLPCAQLICEVFPSKSIIPDADAEPLPQEYRGLQQWMLENEKRVARPQNSPRLPISGQLADRIDFLHPYMGDLIESMRKGYNNVSMILRVRGQGCSALLTGDLEAAGWALMEKRKDQAKAEVLKFPHHGAWKEPDGRPADPIPFLNAVGANAVIFSVGSHQRGYSHPDSHVFDAVRLTGAKILCTQATSKCGLSSPNLLGSTTSSILKSTMLELGVEPVLCSKGTPCAGTIIIDLADIPVIRSPNPSLHRSKIVETYFASSHQCI
jgi:competence protein ComEC